MNDLIEALNIFLAYAKNPNAHAPTHCEHDVLVVVGIPRELEDADVKRLDGLGFFWSEEYDGWASFRFGSA